MDETKNDQADAEQSETEQDDVTIEEEPEEGDPQDALKKLRQKLATAVSEKQQYLDGWQRMKADYANAKKREEAERKEFLKFANEEVLLDIIPTLDTFDIAMSNKEAWEKVSKEWRMGVEYIYSQLLSALEKHGVTQENPIGIAFDPAIHAPIDLIPTDKPEDDGKILQVLKKGYLLNGKRIRPAEVKVGELKK